MEQQNLQQATKEKNLFREILYVLKKNIIVLIAIIVAAAAIGGVYASVRKPNYIADELVTFSMGDRAYVANDFNTMTAYKATVHSFATQGVVLDRANYYAQLYYKDLKDQFTIDELVYQVTLFENHKKNLESEKQIWNEIYRKNIVFNSTPNTETKTRLNLQEELGVLHQQAMFTRMIRGVNEEIAIEKAKGQACDETRVATLEATLSKYNSEFSRLLRSDAEVNEDYSYRAYYEAMGFATDRANGFLIEDADQDKFEISRMISNLEGEISQVIKNSPFYYDLTLERNKENAGKQIYIKSGNINVTAHDDEESNFVFNISYTDSTETAAKDNVRLLTLAFNIEAGYFFTNANAKIDDLGLKSCSVDISKLSIILISIVIGMIVALLVVYLIQKLDKTVKSREDVEKITGYPVLACIKAQEEVQ